MTHANLHYVVVSAIGDIISAFAVAGTLMGYLPDAAAVAAFLWYAVQLYESKTGQRVIKYLRRRHR